MYSPKLREDLIPQLYKLAKEQKRPMTKILDGLIRDKLIEQVHDKPILNKNSIPEINNNIPTIE